jgi:hypothetical protein
LKALFEFITDPNIPDADVDCRVEEAIKNAQETLHSNEAEVEQEVLFHNCFPMLVFYNIMFLFLKVFKKVFIPRTLDDVVHFERDVRRMQEGVDTEYVSAYHHNSP